MVSYYGKQGSDTSGVKFRHGERVHQGERGVWETTLGPGKYPFNTYAGQIIRVPTTNFVLHWITGKSEGHRYDETLKSIDLITKDAYEPMLPLSVVVHIDYQKAPNVIQRFGDVKKLITQTIDPMLSAYFRDVAHKKTMLELVHSRDEIQGQARTELRAKFEQFDIECVDVLIGKPEGQGGRRQNRKPAGAVAAAAAFARADRNLQQAGTGRRQAQGFEQRHGHGHDAGAIDPIEDPDRNHLQPGRSRPGQGRKDAERRVVTAKADSESVALEGRGKSESVDLVGAAEAKVLSQKVESFGDSKLYAISLVADSLAHSQQPLVPETMLGGEGGQAGMLGTLMSLLVADKLGVPIPKHRPAIIQPAEVKEEPKE